MSNKLVSIVIPTLNSADTIDDCLTSIEANNGFVDYEVIVVDGGSTDSTVEIAQKHTVTLLSSEKPQSRQRNTGIEHASGEIIAFTDSDCVVSKNWLSTLVKNFNDPSIAGVGGSNLTPPDDSLLSQCIGALFESLLGSAGARNTAKYKTVREVNHNPPSNSAVRKHVLKEIGGFGDEFRYGEDVVLDAKIKRKGYKLIYNPDLIVCHPRVKTMRGFFKQLFRYGRGRAYSFIRYPESIPITYFLVTIFALGTIFSIPLAILLPILNPVLIAGWAVYFSFLLIISLYIAIQHKRPIYFFALPFLSFLEHFTLGIGFITGLIHQEKLKPRATSR